MAKKKEERLSYLQMPLPQEAKETTTVKVNWSGLNYRQTKDSGALSYEKNISTDEAPYLTPAEKIVFRTQIERVYQPTSESEDESGVEAVEETNSDTKNSEKVLSSIYGYQNLLFTMYHQKVSTTSTPPTSYFIKRVRVYDEKLENENFEESVDCLRFDIGDSKTSDAATLSKNAADSDTGRIFATAFLKIATDNIETDDENEEAFYNKVLFFPHKKSLDIREIKTVQYRYKTSYLGDSRKLIYPWSFVNDFVDKSVVYNVVENPSMPLPEYSQLAYIDLGDNIARKHHSSYDDSEVMDYYYNGKKYSRVPVYALGFAINRYDYVQYPPEYTKAWVYGYWHWDKDKNKWMPLGFDLNTKQKNHSPFSNVADISTAPELHDVAVFQSRLFGIDQNKVYASGFGDYANWNMDTAEEVSSQNAWYSLLSANPEADGRLTAITAYQDRVVVFRENYMYEIRNTKNPFRVVDIFNEGCIGPDACAVVNGYLLFANKNGVRMYTGAKPRDIGYQLGMNVIYYATSGTDGRKWYLYCETDKKAHNLFVYDTTTGIWSELEVEKRFISFTKNDNGLYALSDDNCIYRLDSGDYTGQEWAAETDLTVGNTVNIKHIKKLQLLAELATGSELRVYTLYDDEVFDPETSVCVYQRKNETEKSITIPIRVLVRKSAHYGCRIRIEGTGYAKVYHMEITLTGGGELYRGEES